VQQVNKLKKSGRDVGFGLRKAKSKRFELNKRLQFNNDLTGPEYKIGVLGGTTFKLSKRVQYHRAGPCNICTGFHRYDCGG